MPAEPDVDYDAHAYEKIALGTLEASINPPGARISVAPIIDPEMVPKRPNEMILELEEGVDQKISVIPSLRRRSLGSFNPKTTSTRISYDGDLDTTSHEVAHNMADRFGILDGFQDKATSPFDAELSKFWDFGSKPPAGHPNPKSYKREEGLAEWVRAWILNPEAAIEAAPEFSEHFFESVPEETVLALRKFGDEIRKFEGGTGHEQIMANVGTGKPPGTPMSKLTTILTGGKSTSGPGFRVSVWDKFRGVFQSRAAAYESAIMYAQGVRGMEGFLPENDPAVLARITLGHNGVIEDIVEEGMTNFRDKRLIDPKTNQPMNLKWLYESLDKTSASAMEAEKNEVISLMIARRVFELTFRMKKERVAGIGFGIIKDWKRAEKRMEEFSQETPEKQARIMEAIRRYRALADSSLRFMVDSGRLAAADYARIKRANIEYVAMMRIQELDSNQQLKVTKSTGGKGLGLVSQPLKKIKGSTKLIVDPYISLYDGIDRSIKESKRNSTMKVFRDLVSGEKILGQHIVSKGETYESVAEDFSIPEEDIRAENKDRELTEGLALKIPHEGRKAMYDGAQQDLASIGQQVKVSDFDSSKDINIFVDGKREVWRFNKEIFTGLKGLNELNSRIPNWLPTIMGSHLFRKAIVNTPPFAIRNVMRDMQSRLILSETRGKVKGRIEKAGRMTESDLARTGGSFAGHYLHDQVGYHVAMEATIRELTNTPNTIIGKAGTVYDAYMNIIQKSEMVTRLKEYNSAHRYAKEVLGYDNYNAGVYAAFQTRELMDFAVSGTIIGDYINPLIPFTNAGIQGISRKAKEAKKNPAAFMTRWLLFALVPELINRYLISLWGPDKEDEWKQFSAHRKDMFYNIPVTDDLWLAIPKDYDVGILSSGVTRMIDFIQGDENAFEGYSGSLARAMLPVDPAVDTFVPPLLSTGLSLQSNYDFWRDKNIIPHNEERLELEFRDTSRGSRLGQAIESAAGIDARKVDFAFRSQFGIAGDLAIRTSDIGREDKPDFGLTNISGVFNNAPVHSAMDVSWVTKTSAENGLTGSSEYKELRKLITKYYAAETPRQKDITAKKARDFATKIREKWEDNLPIPKRLEKILKNK